MFRQACIGSVGSFVIHIPLDIEHLLLVGNDIQLDGSICLLERIVLAKAIPSLVQKLQLWLHGFGAEAIELGVEGEIGVHSPCEGRQPAEIVLRACSDIVDDPSHRLRPIADRAAPLDDFQPVESLGRRVVVHVGVDIGGGLDRYAILQDQHA